jgi:hypothetical protein
MKRKSLIWIPPLALLSLGIAQAQTTPPTPQQQTPPASGQQGQQGQQAQPMPQQAQPTPKPASTAQINKCSQVGDQVLGNLNKGKFSQASTQFESKLGVDKGKLQKMWKQLTDKFGNMKSSSKATQGQQIQGYTVVLMPVSFDKAKLAAEIACDSKGSLADLRFGQLPGSQPPASSKS